MIFKPAHKQDRQELAPGQIVNRPPEQTLGDYIARKNYHDAFDRVAEEMGLKRKQNKLTFDEWWSRQLPVYGDKPFEYMVDAAEAAWKAGQENV